MNYEIDLDNLETNQEQELPKENEELLDEDTDEQQEEDSEETPENSEESEEESSDEQEVEDESEKSSEGSEKKSDEKEKKEKSKKHGSRAQRRIQTLSQERNELKEKLKAEQEKVKELSKQTYESKKRQVEDQEKSIKSNLEDSEKNLANLETQYQRAKAEGDTDALSDITLELAEARINVREARKQYETFTPEKVEEPDDNLEDASDESQVNYGKSWAEDRQEELQEKQHYLAAEQIAQAMINQGKDPKEPDFWNELDGYFDTYLEKVEENKTTNKGEGVKKPTPPTRTGSAKKTPTGGKKTIALTEEQKQTAKNLGVSYEDYRNQLKKNKNTIGYEIL